MDSRFLQPIHTKDNTYVRPLYESYDNYYNDEPPSDTREMPQITQTEIDKIIKDFEASQQEQNNRTKALETQIQNKGSTNENKFSELQQSQQISKQEIEKIIKEFEARKNEQNIQTSALESQIKELEASQEEQNKTLTNFKSQLKDNGENSKARFAEMQRLQEDNYRRTNDRVQRNTNLLNTHRHYFNNNPLLSIGRDVVNVAGPEIDKTVALFSGTKNYRGDYFRDVDIRSEKKNKEYQMIDKVLRDLHYYNRKIYMKIANGFPRSNL